MEQVSLYNDIRRSFEKNAADEELFISSDYIPSSIDGFPKSVNISVTENNIKNYAALWPFIKRQCHSQDESDIFAECFSAEIKKEYKCNIVKWEPNKCGYPKHMLLGADRGILAYIEFFYHKCEENISKNIYLKYGIWHALEKLVEKVSLVDSDLDRPVFYIHYIDFPHLKGIVYETAEQIKDCLFNEAMPVINFNNESCCFSNLSELGSFEELVGTFQDLKKNNVRFN